MAKRGRKVGKHKKMKKVHGAIHSFGKKGGKKGRGKRMRKR